MAYNNGFPVTYQSMYYPQYQQPQQPTQNNGVIWVQGEAGAKSYLVAPNSTVQLWDSETQTIYLKSADASGMPAMKVLDYTIRENGSSKADAPNSYATKDELDALAEKFDRLRADIDEINARREKKRREYDDD